MKRKPIIQLTLIALIGAGVAIAGSGPSINRPADPELIIPSETSFTPSVTEAYDGKEWVAGRTTSALGQDCVEIRSPSGWRATTCPPAGTLGREQIVEYTGGTPNVYFIYGLAASDIKHVELIRADCSVRELPLSPDGMFLDVYAPEAASPYRLRFLDVARNPLGTRPVEGRAAGTPVQGLC